MNPFNALYWALITSVAIGVTGIVLTTVGVVMSVRDRRGAPDGQPVAVFEPGVVSTGEVRR